MIRPSSVAAALALALVAALVTVAPRPAPLDPRYPWAVQCRPMTCGEALKHAQP